MARSCRIATTRRHSPEQIANGEAFYNYNKGKLPLEDLSGFSVFIKADNGEIFHTYSTFGRGAEMLGGSYYWLDLTALGRQEAWEEPKGRAESARSATPDFAT